MSRIRFLLCFLLIVSFACSSVKPENTSRLIETSSPTKPEWILKKRKSDENYYFVGIGKKNNELQNARKSAISDAASRLLEFIGFRATTRFKSTKEFRDFDDSSSFREEILQTIEGKASASVIIEIEDTYYEKYTDGYLFYVLLKSPVKWVEKERKRLKKLLEEQRNLAILNLNEAKRQFENGEVVKAIDNTILAIEISEKAEENSDIYEEAKDFLISIISSLRFSLKNKPLYVYKEGGSDEIQLMITTTKNYKPVTGLLIELTGNDKNLTFTAKKGLQTDESGIVLVEINQCTPDEEVEIGFSFSLKKFEKLKEIDEEFYSRIKKYNEILKLSVKLSIKEKYKAIPSGVVIIDTEEDKGFSFKFQENVTGFFANRGFNVSSIEISKIAKSTDTPEKVKNSVISLIRKEYNSKIKNLIIIFRNFNYIGEIGKDIKFTEYDLNDSGIKVYEILCSIFIINLETGNTEKAFNFSVKGSGLNKSQALQNSEKKILEKLKEFFI